MAKITRYDGNLQAFASQSIGTERTIFGEITQANDLTSQINADFLRGWAIVGPADQPTLQDFNGAMYTHGQFLAYLHQVGVPGYHAEQEYQSGGITVSGGVIYISLQDVNVGNTPASSPLWWKEPYPQATEAIRGTAKVATQAKAEAGSDDLDMMTALKTKQAIAKRGTFYSATKAAGDALAASLGDGATVIVDRDEILGGVQARRVVASGALGAPVPLTATQIQNIPIVFVPSAGSPNVVTNPLYNAIAPSARVATINGGGDPASQQLIGYGHNRQVFNGAGSTFRWNYLPALALTGLRVHKIATNNLRTILSAGSGYSTIVGGSYVDITLVSPLIAGERLIVEDADAVVATGSDPSYSWVGGGYDCVIVNGVMGQVTGAHHRVVGGDHGSIFGGSYGSIYGGSYGAILGGTDNELGSGAGVASAILGGYRNYINASTSIIIGGQENRVLAGLAAIIGGQSNQVSGTASACAGRLNIVGGADSFAVGRENTCSADYSIASGYKNVISSGARFCSASGEQNTLSAHYTSVAGLKNDVAHKHSHIRAGQHGATSWEGQDIKFTHKTSAGVGPKRQKFSLNLFQTTPSTSSALMTGIDGVTTAFAVPTSSVWKCRLEVSARGGNGKGATFDLAFSVRKAAAADTVFIGATDIIAKVEAGMGVGPDAASVSVAIVNDSVEVTVKPRTDAAVNTSWYGTLEVVEVTV